MQVGHGFSPVIWRNATAADLREKEERERRSAIYWSNSPFFPRGIRITVRQSAGFNRGAKGVVEYQLPGNGKVFVLRDGASDAIFYHGSELMVDERLTGPLKCYRTIDNRPDIGGRGESWTWFVLGYNRFKDTAVRTWCERSIGEKDFFVEVVRDREHDPVSGTVVEHHYAHAVGFKNDEDATLFYLAHR
jgi:hypothetical protein